MDGIKECPHCGWRAVVITKQYNVHTTRYRIQCDNAGCQCKTPWLCYYEDAVTVWNRREHDAVPVVRCGECIHMMPNGECEEFADDVMRPSAADFCSHGVKKEQK